MIILTKLSGMRYLGEFTLTDSRLSRIDIAIPSDKLYLENMCGTAHIAFGSGYKKCFEDKNNTPDCNEVSGHEDMVIAGDFAVIAELADGSSKIISSNGQFTLF